MTKKNTTREEIAALRREIARLQSRPADAASIHEAVTAAVRLRQAEYHEWADSNARTIAHDPVDGCRDVFASFSFNQTLWTSRAMFGLLADRLIDDLTARATARSNELGEPLNPRERAKQDLTLRRRMYQLELQDVAESIAAGVPLRPDVNAAAVLGAPVDEAEEAGLL
jgi:hypothetical protein